MSITIRDAAATDRAACLDLLAQLSAATGSTHSQIGGETFDALLDHSRGKVLVADEAGTLLGMASISFNLAMRYGGEYCQLEELIVTPQARGKNVGGQLVEATVAAARARGCGEYGLYLVEATTHNQPFYEKYGFEMVGAEMRQRLD